MRRFIDTARRALDFGSNVGDLRVIPSMPVIVIQGDADRLVRVENTRKWIDEMKSLGMTFE